MAQLGSALDWGSRGRRFKSCQPDQRKRRSERVFVFGRAPASSFRPQRDADREVHQPAAWSRRSAASVGRVPEVCRLTSSRPPPSARDEGSGDQRAEVPGHQPVLTAMSRESRGRGARWAGPARQERSALDDDQRPDVGRRLDALFLPDSGTRCFVDVPRPGLRWTSLDHSPRARSLPHSAAPKSIQLLGFHRRNSSARRERTGGRGRTYATGQGRRTPRRGAGSGSELLANALADHRSTTGSTSIHGSRRAGTDPATPT